MILMEPLRYSSESLTPDHHHATYLSTSSRSCIPTSMERLLATDLYTVDVYERTMYIVFKRESEDQTDAVPYKLPDQTEPIREADGRVSYYVSADNTKVDRLWRKRLGQWVYEDVVKDELARRGIGESSSQL